MDCPANSEPPCGNLKQPVHLGLLSDSGRFQGPAVTHALRIDREPTPSQVIWTSQ